MAYGKILIIDDEVSQLELLEMFFDRKGYEVRCASTALEGLSLHGFFKPDVTILDIRLPDMDGLDVLKELKKQNHATIIITAYHDMETTVRAMKTGACEYIMKPIDLAELHDAVQRSLKLIYHDEERSVSPGLPLLQEGPIIGKSKAMKEVFKAIGMLSDNRVTVLIQGETGTGKELIAKAIHYYSPSPYKEQPFLPINCSTIVGSLLESELFGYEKGAFTGALVTTKGKFEQVGSGTIFLDEIGEMPIELQAKILRFIQEKEFYRLGSAMAQKSSAKIIAATNKNLSRMVTEGRFREDLYYRLSVARIQVPPLRERKSDIMLIVGHLLRKLNAELGKNIIKVEETAIRMLIEYDWPGNVRQLENVLTRAAIVTHGEVILDHTIQFFLCDDESNKGHQREASLSLREIEREHIEKILNHTNWRLGKAAHALGISRPTLNLKIKQYGLLPK